jgi:hypothetical protein
MNPLHPTYHSLKIHLNNNNIFPSKSGPSIWSLSFRLPHQNSVCTSSILHTCYVPCPSHSSRFYDPNIW